MTNLSTVHFDGTHEFVSRFSVNNNLSVNSKDNEITIENGAENRTSLRFTPHIADRPLIAQVILPAPDPLDVLPTTFLDDLNRLTPGGLLAAIHAGLNRLSPEPVDSRDVVALNLLAGYHGLSGTGASGPRWASWSHVPSHLLEGAELSDVRSRWRKVAVNAEKL